MQYNKIVVRLIDLQGAKLYDTPKSDIHKNAGAIVTSRPSDPSLYLYKSPNHPRPDVYASEDSSVEEDG